MLNSGMYSSATVEWSTPQWLFDELDKRFHFTVDVCATRENAKTPRYWTKEENGLSRSWRDERAWMNPPYSRTIGQWVSKARQESEQGALVVGLLPARPDTRWWQQNVQGHADVRFIAGRLKFGNAKNAAPFASAIAVWWGWDVMAGKFADPSTPFLDYPALPGV